MAGKQVVKMMTAKEVEKLSRLEGRHAVGGCASLYIQRIKGSTSWVLRVLVNGKRREMGLGAYPSVTLDEAREKCMALRKQVRDGIDPLEEKRQAKQERKVIEAKTMTFAQCVDAYLDAHEDSWKNPKHRQQWRNTLETYANPVFGDLPVSAIDRGMVEKCLSPIWKTKTETASRLRGRIEKVLSWATAREYRHGENPARWKDNLETLLANPSKIHKVEHHAALPYAEIGAFMVELAKMDGLGARALEFGILCASRSGEVRGAAWSEIDLKSKLWIIPADRMKMEREHRVPLSERAMKLLEAMPRIADTDLLFPGRKGPMSDMSLTAVLKRMGRGDLTQHGFRSTFRDWVFEETNYPNVLGELCLAHRVGDETELAYRRGDGLKKRFRLMEDWARYCYTIQHDENNVVPIRKAS